MSKVNKLQQRQTDLINKINHKLSEEEKKELAEIIDIEYKLTMAGEGHPSELD